MAKSEKTSAKKPKKVTPLMQQYFGLKNQYPDAILLYRVGDFYETFGEDAIKTSQVLGIVLTKRNNGGSDIELAGFPYHSLDLYLPRLVKAGLRVAICEQLEKPSKEKKIVKRGVTEMVTPGVAISDQLLENKQNNFLAAIHFGRNNHYGLAFLDISTGEFLVSEGDSAYTDKLLQSFSPSEVLYSRNRKKNFDEQFGDRFYAYQLDDWIFTTDYTEEKLQEHFEVNNLKGFGIEQMELAKVAAGACLHYLATTENTNLKHVNTISRMEPDRYVWLDRFTIRNLELIFSPHDNGVPLIQILDKTVSPMGGRLLKKWVVLPLKHLEDIALRHSIVSHLLNHNEVALAIEEKIREMGDLERLISKVPLMKINPREVRQLQRAIEAITPIKSRLEQSDLLALQQLGTKLDPCNKLVKLVEKTICNEPPVNLAKGAVIADGINEELDDLRHIVKNSKDILLEIQQTEAERTGITNLKIGFNNVFGYYLEVTNKHKGQAPEEWVRKQTLTNAERYITEDLKKLESKILGAQDKILELESRLYEQLVLELSDFISPVQRNAAVVAQLDCLLSFAKVALKNDYSCPQMDDSYLIDIKAGRHPVIEQQMALDESFVPNDVYLDNEEQQIMMITGPNMAGKSALLRQTALICLMAQMGSYVPARSARLGLIDKVFTRVGASDNISSGESTFMVEMNETASIMNNVSDRSLILLDEIGRGTSTYDGISIAWSIAEYLHHNPSARAKTLFATHYHELNELANRYSRIKNYNIATKEVDKKVIFLRKLVPGGSNHSFGIYVAKMAGMPRVIVERANQILHTLEQKSIENGGNTHDMEATKANLRQLPAEPVQLSIFESVDPMAEQIMQQLQDTDLNAMTPIECMMKLAELKKLLT